MVWNSERLHTAPLDDCGPMTHKMTGVVLTLPAGVLSSRRSAADLSCTRIRQVDNAAEMWAVSDKITRATAASKRRGPQGWYAGLLLAAQQRRRSELLPAIHSADQQPRLDSWCDVAIPVDQGSHHLLPLCQVSRPGGLHPVVGFGAAGLRVCCPHHACKRSRLREFPAVARQLQRSWRAAHGVQEVQPRWFQLDTAADLVMPPIRRHRDSARVDRRRCAVGTGCGEGVQWRV